MSNVYQLVNPHIEGEFKNKIKADNSMKAAKQFYRALSEHFNNNVPKFYFTIQKGASGKGKYYHFVAKETKSEDEVNFNIEPHVMSDESMSRFQSRVDEFKSKFAQAGGKKKKSSKKAKKASAKPSKFYDDDSELSDSSEDFYRRVQTYRPTVTPPLYYWWYDPLVYNLESVFIPTFYSYVTPYIEIKI
jgi:hypothetical protein